MRRCIIGTRQRKGDDHTELTHISGNTWVIHGATALMPLYLSAGAGAVLMDTGYAVLDRSSLVTLFHERGWQLQGILCSHAHFDHAGSVRYFQQQYGCPVACHADEAAVAADPVRYREAYVALPGHRNEPQEIEECFTADVRIAPDADHLDFCGSVFGVLQLPGHSAGHVGFVTPDGVAYLGDALISREVMAGSDLPVSMSVGDDLRTKESLRQLRYPRYILAHKEVVTDLAPLIDENIAYYHRHIDTLLASLQGAMTAEQWFESFCTDNAIPIKSPLRRQIAWKNFRTFVRWLTESGRIALSPDCAYCRV